MQDLPVILKLNNFQSLEKALNCFIELKFRNSDVFFLNRRKKMCRWPRIMFLKGYLLEAKTAQKTSVQCICV